MHVRAPHGRVAFGLGRLRAADPAVPTVVADDLDGSLAAGGLLLLWEEAAAVGGGGCCCCWGRRLRLLGEEAAAEGGRCVSLLPLEGALQGWSWLACCRDDCRQAHGQQPQAAV